jgi:flagella synthesis protein FlgN
MSVVAGILEREIELISRFIVALNEEQACLTAANPAALPEISATKSGLVEQLNALEGERMTAIGITESPSNRATMESWLARNNNDANATVAWEKLLILAREAKTLHELNGRLVDLHLRNTTEILGILTQEAKQTGLYDASGQAMPTTGSRIVDSA